MEAADNDVQSILQEIDTLFEPSPTLHVILTRNEERLLSESDAGHVTEDMITYIGTILESLMGRPELDEILNAHPRLGANNVTSTHSRAEQSSLQPDSEEADKLRALNNEYEAKFPGLRYVVFVNGRTRSIVMEDMKARIARGDINAERQAGTQAMLDIARDRLRKSKITA